MLKLKQIPCINTQTKALPAPKNYRLFTESAATIQPVTIKKQKNVT